MQTVSTNLSEQIWEDEGGVYILKTKRIAGGLE